MVYTNIDTHILILEDALKYQKIIGKEQILALVAYMFIIPVSISAKM